MKIKIIVIIVGIIFLINLVSAIENPFYYKLSLSYEKSNLEIKNIEIEFLDRAVVNYGNNLIKVFDFKEKLTYEDNFTIPNIILYDEFDKSGVMINGGEKKLEKVNFELYIPYYENAKEIVIYDSELNELAREDVSMYSKDSNNEIEIRGEIIKGEGSIKDKKSFINYWWVLLLVIVILIGLIIYFYRRKRNEKTK